MTNTPAHNIGPGRMLAEGTKDEIRAIVTQVGGVPTQGQRLPDGRLRVLITLPPGRAVSVRWWQGRSWKFWTSIGTGTAAALGGCAWVVVAIIQAALSAAAAAAPAFLGALLIVAAVIGVAKASGSKGTWTGSGTWR